MSLDLSLSTSEMQKYRRSRRLNIYSEIYKKCRIRFDYAQVVLGIIKALLKSADFSALTTHAAPDYVNVNPENLLGRTCPDSRPKNWAEVLFRSPLIYLRMISRLDRSLSNGYYALDEYSVTNMNKLGYSSADKDISMDNLAVSPSSLPISSPSHNQGINLDPRADDPRIIDLSDSFGLEGEALDWTADLFNENELFGS